MNYALMEDGIVVNIISLDAGNASDFPGAVPVGDRPVMLGDACENGVFLREGKPVKTHLEEANEVIGELDKAVVELMYQNIAMQMGL